jgi:hypothetical protein
MADYIPFVYTTKDTEILNRYYPDSAAVRLSLESADVMVPKLAPGPKLWLDPAIDGLHRWPEITPQYRSHVGRFAGFNEIGDPKFHSKPAKDIVDRFVHALLDECTKLKPEWLSVPQLPLVADSTRNKINRQLAESTQRWKVSKGFQGKLILPVILTHQKQVHLKAQRDKRVELATSCYGLSGASGIWVVDSSLSDQDGTTTFEHTRFPDLIAFHQELRQALMEGPISIGGPYWGVNLILWARGLVHHPAVGLGNSYQYHLPGGIMSTGKTRIALPPLRRWAIASAQLEDWLRHALKELPPGDEAYVQLAEISKDFSRISLDGRAQVARFYKVWFDQIASVAEDGRALALYHDLSSAYVAGKGLPDLPKAEGTGRKAFRVAKQFMVNCL